MLNSTSSWYKFNTVICLSAELTTPSIPYMVKNVLTLVQVVMLMTGRIALRLKTKFRASRRAGWFG